MDLFKIEPKNLDSSMSSSSEAINIPPKRVRVEFNPDDLIVDPGVRNNIESYDVAIRDQVRMEYLSRGPCQPYDYGFPKKKQGKNMRSFQESWFIRFPWLEYSIEKDSAYCFYCYLFARPTSRSAAFTSKGFNNWKKAIEAFNEHAGGVSSVHNSARCDSEDFQNQQRSMSLALIVQNPETEVTYHMRLKVVLHVVRFLLLQGLSFRCDGFGCDESSIFPNKGNFLEMMIWYADCNESVRNIIGDNVDDYNQMTSRQTQKELVNLCASQTTSVMLSELGDSNFSILIDEICDDFEQHMVVILRFVNKNGEVIERFLAIEPISDFSSGSLKAILDALFARHGLSISRLRGQAYGEVSNMRGEVYELKALIQNENPFAFHFHHFAHQLQLVVVFVVKNIFAVWDLFTYTTMIVKTVGDSSKRRDPLQQKKHEDILKRLEADEIFLGRDKYQETNFVRLCDTRWGSYYVTLIRLMSMWDSVLWVLEEVHEDGSIFENCDSAGSLIEKMESFQFVFVLHLMVKILGTTNDLSNILLQNDRSIVSALKLIEALKEALQKLREDGWDALLQEVVIFCHKMHIPVPDMEEQLPRSRRREQSVTYYHHYHNEVFLAVIDLLVVEVNNRFSETSNVLLGYISYLDPRNSFARFDHHKLICFAKLYSDDFSSTDLFILRDQLETYICDVRKSSDFTNCHDLASLAIKMVQTSRHLLFPLVYRLIELALILPVATASVERAISSKKIIKTELCDLIKDEWINDRMVCYIERRIFDATDDEDILQHFQNMQCG
ncbi:uncharacterized protein LOC126670458 [Mercurialis annua]|uniref:uncharacterized protein LOC126670458 n=1 Tax=Mercurialis annua TaxID=3986 RepID=UPI002160B6B1|nr:uncharacterized protein LOC126670458 [Mercurialis annua]XP_050220152.1 uncharacterized protein LOC126670458 [Mercurialis annua]